MENKQTSKLKLYSYDFHVERGAVVIEGQLSIQAMCLEDFFAIKEAVLAECFEQHDYEVTDTGMWMSGEETPDGEE